MKRAPRPNLRLSLPLLSCFASLLLAFGCSGEESNDDDATTTSTGGTSMPATGGTASGGTDAASGGTEAATGGATGGSGGEVDDLSARGYHTRFLYAEGAGHCDNGVFDETVADTLVWAWRGYPQ